jgi:toxin ParE1/3/4
MTGYVLLPGAQADLDEIWDYTADLWGIEQANRYARELRSGAEFIARDPRRGRSCHDIRPGYYRYSVGSHVLFYRVTTTGIEIVRVLHQRMDFRRHL